MAMLSKQHHLEVTRNWYKFSSMQVQMSTCREECMAMLSKQHHMEATRIWFTFSSMQVQMSMCREECMAMLSRQHHMEVRWNWWKFSSMQAQMSTCRGGKYGNALQAASYGVHKELVEILLNAGADVNMQGGVYANSVSYFYHTKEKGLSLSLSPQEYVTVFRSPVKIFSI
jgi:hypothetical protein